MTLPAPEPARHHGAAFRFGILVLILVGGFLVARYSPLAPYLTPEKIRAVLERLRDLWWAPAALVATMVVLGSAGVPATPFIIAGAAIFGTGEGILWNFLGILLASVAGYWLARALGRDFIERLGGDKVKRAERFLHRRGFMPLVAVRFLPVPFTLVNAAAAVVGVRFWRFLASTAIGLLPSVTILTYFSSALLEAATGADRARVVRHLMIVAFLCAIVVFLPVAIQRRRRIWRLRDLRQLRRERGAARALPK